MILAITIIMVLAWGVLFIIGGVLYNAKMTIASSVCFCTAIVCIILGGIFGFTSYPPTEGTHQGVITAVDLEGKYFRRYEVYLKSSGYTTQSDETVYKIYDYETELAEELKDCIGKEVKLTYGHDGGYITWDSCGTYHIKSIELVEK